MIELTIFQLLIVSSVGIPAGVLIGLKLKEDKR